MKDVMAVAEPLDYDERTKSYNFTPATQLHLEGRESRTEPKKASVTELAGHTNAARQKRRAA